MHQYRICKYDPQFRVGGAYVRPEWTSIADVGNEFDGRIFTMSDYERAEQRHIAFLCALTAREDAYPLTLEALEVHCDHSPWHEGQQITPNELPAIVRDLLREECWCRLTAPGFFIHFGYEYYMYVGCTHTTEAIAALASTHGLFAETMTSPYHPEPEVEAVPTDLRPMTAIYLTRGEEILLLYRTGSRVVGNSYTGSAGGHMEPEEYNSARACVLRELREETGLTADALDGLAMRYVTMRLKDGEIRQNYYFFAELRDRAAINASNEGRLRWFRLDELSALPMPHTAKQVLMHYVAEGRFTNLLYGAISRADGAAFTPMEEF